jgi:hypothetical protein
MKKIVVSAITAALALSFGACSDKTASEQVEQVKISQTQTTAVSAAETVDSLPSEEFCELPDEAVEDLNYISEISGKLFPDAAGKKMYGYKGLEEIETENGSFSCYMFDFYTYKSKVYTKIAELAKPADSSDVYVFSVESGSYVLSKIPQSEINWHDKATEALAADIQQ